MLVWFLIMRRIPELDGLRAIAILLVIGCHYAPIANSLGRWPAFGWVGVDLFFALSGYLITTILLGMRHKPQPYRTFYARRFARIFPPYFAVIAFITALSVGRHLDVLNLREVFKQVFFLEAFSPSRDLPLLASLLHPVRTIQQLPPLMTGAHHLHAAIPGLPPAMGAVPGIFWSLSIEEYFYVVWAPIALRFRRSGIVIAGICICLLSIFFRWQHPAVSSYFGMFTHFDGLIYGSFLALLLEHWRKQDLLQKKQVALSLIGVAAVAVLAVVLYLIHPIAGMEVRESPLFLVFGLTALDIACAALVGVLVVKAESPWWLSRVLNSYPFQYLGTISYTLYLVHIIAAWFIYEGLSRSLHIHHYGWLEVIASFVLAVALARASWHFVEKPVLRWKDRRFPSAPHPREPALN